MAIADRIAAATRALIGASAFEPPATSLALSPEDVDQLRKLYGGQLQPIPTTVTRWYQADLETALRQADQGKLQLVGRLWRAMRRDGFIDGLADTRTSGLLALPKRFRGDDAMIKALRAESGTRTVFDEMFPPAELAKMAADEIGLGVGVGELVPVEGRAHPVLVRLDPEFLEYRWHEGRWYYHTVAGPVVITPGDGRWILHIGGGRMAPWHNGKWHSLGRAFIAKEHAMLHRGNYGGKLANPARVAQAPSAASEMQRQGFLAKLIAWGVNTVFELPPGWEVKLIESNGRGWEVFGTDIDTANQEIMIALAGQVVTVTGGSGFANASIHATIRADLIKRTADALAHTLNTQGIPPWVIDNYGIDTLDKSPRVEWDIAPPEDRKAEAEGLQAIAGAIDSLSTALAAHGLELDADEVINRFGIPVAGALSQDDERPQLELAPTDVAKVVRVREVRASQGLGPLGDERDDMTVNELAESLKQPPPGTEPDDAEADNAGATLEGDDNPDDAAGDDAAGADNAPDDGA